jgi:hypothetical protein
VQKYLITSFDSGFYNVPPVFVEISNSSGIKRYYSDYNVLEVIRVKISPPDTAAGIFDIIGPYKVPLTIWEIMPWILGAALLIVLGYFGYLVYRNYMKKGDLGPEEIISEPAHIIAFRELEKLLQEKLWQDGQVKLYYTRLTEIIRQYLDNRFGISSLELTTSETLHELKKSGFREEESFGMLKKILSAADLVKFAKYKPHPDENEVIFTLSWDFVQSTRLEIKVDENVSSEQSGGEK